MLTAQTWTDDKKFTLRFACTVRVNCGAFLMCLLLFQANDTATFHEDVQVFSGRRGHRKSRRRHGTSFQDGRRRW